MRILLPFPLFAIALLSSCSTQSPKGQDLDKAFRPLIWPETKMLAAIDVAGVKKSALYKQHEKELIAMFNRMGADRFGIDVRRDVEYLAFSSDGKRSVFFAKGNFKNVKQSELQQAGSGVVFLSDRIALAGDKESIRSARALEDAGKGEVPEELASRLHALGKADQVWLVSRGPLPVEDLSLRNDTRANLGNFVKLINGLTAGLAADDGLRLNGRVSSSSPEGAARIHDAFRGLIGLARLSTKDNEADMLKMYDAFDIKKNGNLVEVKAELSSADVNKLLLRIPGR